ncbi:PKD domain-containing protein [Aquiflexum sp.]|uniref:PKD domain-containing protein n=1 Tax=Aquiflexum sp. TaxID=1872584 RepID=UPI003593DDC0
MMLYFPFFNFTDSNAQVGFPYCEDFQDSSTQSATVFGGSARLVSGVLRLTDAQLEQNGYIYIDIPFPSAFGIKTSFEFFVYGGNGADGLTVFLFDATIPNFRPGGFGGSLGYAQRGQTSGLTGAYLGIGLDSFGNFGISGEGKIGGFFGGGTTLYPNSIVVRGAGTGLTGYQFVTGKWTNNEGEFGLPAADRFPLESGGVGSARVTDPNIPGYRKLFVDLEPHPGGVGYSISVDLMVTTTPGNPRMVKVFDETDYIFEAPENLKIGFAASTGGLTNIHEIRNLQVEVSDQDRLENPTGTDIDDKASCEGQENTYEITREEITLPNEGSSIRCLQLYGSLDEIEAEADDICSQGRCRPENREMVLPQGTFRAADEGGSFTFFPNFGFVDETVEIYYTVTDNYGKTSSGNFIRLLIQESPEPVNITGQGLDEEENEIRLCEGDGILLSAVGEEVYVRFEWFRDGVLIPDSDYSEYFADQAGEYTVTAYNSKSCPTESAEFKLINPVFPNLNIENPVVGCTPGMTLDVREFIADYNDDDFDYRLETPQGQFLVNDEMSSVGLSGPYEISIKHKDLECWSDPVVFDLIIVLEPLNSRFEYEVDGTGITGDEGGGIFIDDPIRFNDLSTGGAIAWNWDFGDGNTSNEQSPVHVFGKKGNFLIKLTITNQFGCEDTFEMELPLTRSFRVMFPTGFTPTLSENQFFRPKTKGIVKMEMLIFNLWGNMLFRTDDINTEGWDGRVNGELMPSGNYVYRINMESIDGDKIEENGKFILIR